MKLEETLQRIELMRKRRTAISKAEAENAAHLARMLRQLWVYWRDLLAEFGVKLLYSRNCGNASVGDGRFVFIKLDTGQWHVQQRAPGGWETVARDWGLESLRAYLVRNRTRLDSAAVAAHEDFPEANLSGGSPGSAHGANGRRRGD